MADTLNFGPEWLRALSDGNNPGTPPPSPGIIGKYKLADYRYGKEEMLALNNPNHTEPLEEIKKFTYIYVEKPQEPITMQSLSEEEQRLMSQSVNSTAVLRMFGRGGPPGVRGGRGGIERGRGRGRGRGDSGFLQRGMSAEEGGGFGRPPTHSRSDGWEEVGAKRNYNPRFDEEGGPQRQFHRSLSNENWRDRGGEHEEDEGDWRKAGSKWNTRGNWREPINRGDRGGFDERPQPNGLPRAGFDKGRQYQRNRISESWDEDDNMPEWSMPDTTGDDVGTFDSSGAFVSTKKKPGEKGSENHERREPHTETSEKKDNVKHKSPDKPKVETKVETDKVKRPPPNLENRQNKSENANKRTLEPRENKTVTSESPGQSSKPVNSRPKENNNEVKVSKENNSAQNDFSKSEATMKNEETNVSLKKEKVEAETLARLQAAAENVVLSAMTAEDDEKEKMVPRPAKDSTALLSDHEDALKWFYKDPQGDMQGPFTPNEMAEWFSAGYFTMNLQVKRGIDEKISPLGELIKSWGRVPFLPGPSPPPALNTPTSQATADQQEQMKALQQMLVQQQMMQQQFLMRQLQMQQIQQVMQQLQENDQFKNLPPLQQQQLAMQLMLKQSPVPIIPPQTQMQNLSPSRSPPTESVSPSNPSHPAFHRSASQPNTASEESIWDTTTKQNMGQWSQPTSVWDLDSKAAMTNTDLEMQIEKARKEKEELDRIRQEKDEEERRIQEELKRHQEEIIKQQEELRRQKEDVERQKIEIEKQRQLELQRFEEVRRQNQEEEERKRREVEEEERRRKEDQMRKEEQMRQKQEEAVRRKREEDMRREEEMRQQQRQMMEQQHKQREMEEQQKQQQEMQRRQEEARQQQELHRQKQQQEALKRLQQEQMANIQLPQHAQWASQQQQQSLEQQRAKSLLEIQEQEEIERQRQEEIQRQVEAQRQQQQAILQQQQQQKSWSGQIFPTQQSSKSLIEIQEEQARQLDKERQRKQQQQQTQAKNLSISAASAWNASAQSSHWASEGAWGNQARSQNGSGSLGFWDDAIISSKRAPASSNKNVQGNPTEFPALKGGKPVNTPSVPVAKPQKQSKMKKEEEAVQRLFKQPKPQEDGFSNWCEIALKRLDTSVDIPTFVAFLSEVESPYEVHDYVRSYLGESKSSKDFAKQFLEKRSQTRNKAKPPVVEESIWGPAPARDYRQQTNQTSDADSQKNKGGKKKKKMMKLDSSILGFTVSADPERKNVGEMEDDGK